MIRIKIGIWQSEVYQSIDKAIGKIRFTTTDRNHGSRHDFMFFCIIRHGDELIVNSATTCDGNPTTKFIFEAVELIELGETDSNEKIGEINISSNNKTLRQLVNIVEMKDNIMEVYPCGTKVKMTNGHYDGTIEAISIVYNNVNYEIEYYYQGEFKKTWKRESQFTTDSIKSKLGFNK